MVRFMDAAQTADLLDFKALREALKVAALDMAQGRIHSPDRHALPLGEGGTQLSMPATAPDLGIHKLVTVMPGNGAQGLPTIHGMVTILDADTGRPQCVLDGPVVTGRRTAAVSMLAIDLCTRQAPRRVLLVGTGTQAVYHVQALHAFYPDCVIHVRGSSLAKAEQFCVAQAAEHAHLVADHGTDDEAADWDVVLLTTTATAPVYHATARAHRLVVGVGAFRPDMAEISAHTLAGSALYVDEPSGARHEAGDFIQAGVDWAHVQSLAQAVQQAPDLARPIVFKSVGSAAWDLAAGRVAWAALSQARAGR